MSTRTAGGRKRVTGGTTAMSTSASSVPGSRIAVRGKLAKTLKAERARIAQLAHERMVVVSPEGRTLWVKNGDATGITTSTSQNERYVRGNVAIHNHPFGAGLLPTFSDSDVQFAARSGAAGIQAVTDHGVATMLPRADGTWPRWGTQIRPVFNQHYRVLFYYAHKKMLAGLMTRADLANSEGALMHAAWRKTAKELGLVYRRSKAPSQTNVGHE